MLSIHSNQIMMEHYQEILAVSSVQISVRFDAYIVLISGKDLQILALASSEIYLNGKLESIEFVYEK